MATSIWANQTMIEPTTTVKSILGFSEPINSISHLAGAGFFFILAWPLLQKGRGERRRIIFLATFAFSCVFLLSASGVYHLLDSSESGHATLRRLDHAGIFGLIAGTLTAIHGILFQGAWRWGMILFIWSVAATGITLNSIFIEQMPAWLPVTIYVILGWVGVFTAFKLQRRYGYDFIAPLVYGGVAYTLGAGLLGIMSLLGNPMLVPGIIGRHEIFHLTVLAGIGFHWKFINSFADGKPS